MIIKHTVKNSGIDSRIHEAVKEKTAIVDVDGSYTYLKHKKLTDSGACIAPIQQPTCAPLSGWQVINEANVREMAEKVPRVTSGTCFCNNHVKILIATCIIILFNFVQEQCMSTWLVVLAVTCRINKEHLEP